MINRLTQSSRLLRFAILLMAAMGQVEAAENAVRGNERPRYVSPTNKDELDARLTELRRQYEPFLRSLPQPLSPKRRVSLPKEWRFTYEATEKPKVEGIPPAPAWHSAEFHDAQWETTTVPEWRYRPRIGAMPADTICWYRTKFKAERPVEGRRLWLCFDGVDWESQVWLNGELIGTHRIYYEPFRFDVTDKIKDTNTLAVRVIAGRSYGQPMSFWTLFPDVIAAVHRYVPDAAQSIPGSRPISYLSGCGFGIFREAYMEETGPVFVSAVLARNDLSSSMTRVKVELDRANKRPVDVKVEVLPENFDGRSYTKNATVDTDAAVLEIPMPEARVWSPESPHLYRCRVTVKDSDARDVLFGCRSFSLVHHKNESSGMPADTSGNPRSAELQSGTFLLNGKPVYLRGTNIQGLNAYSYWGQNDKLLNALLLLKAGNFNAVRSCQHVEFPEVLELMDRVGIMSEQDQGGGFLGSIDMGVRREPHIQTGSVLARRTYNNPGVVLLCFGNEHNFPAEPILRAALAVDPQRVIIPISGRFTSCHKPWDLPDDLLSNIIDDWHPYSGWYGKVAPQTWSNLRIFSPSRMVMLGEFGAEALDAYETMRDHYPPQLKPPAPEADTLWASIQVQKHDVRQVAGLGRDPMNLAEYIEASQNYQEALLADCVTGMRLSPRGVAGYFQFHFIDVIPAFWPKSIISHDHRPKKAYYQMAQLNQPVVAVPQLRGARPDYMTLWIANDLSEALPQAKLHWSLDAAGKTQLEGEQNLDVPATGVVQGNTVDLSPILGKHTALELRLRVTDAQGKLVSRYVRQIRVLPESLLKKADQVQDPFNDGKK